MKRPIRPQTRQHILTAIRIVDEQEIPIPPDVV